MFYLGGAKLIPAPTVTWSKEYQTADDGRIVGRIYKIQVRGLLCADKGSPSSSGTWWEVSGYPGDESISIDSRMGSLLNKQRALKEKLQDGVTVEVVPWDSTAPTKFNPSVKSISFQDSNNNWTDTCPYQIELEANTMLLGNEEDTGDPVNYKVATVSEDWVLENLTPAHGGQFRLIHSVSARGKRHYDSTGALTREAWENAQDYVLSRLGLGLNQNFVTASGVLNNTGHVAFDYMRTQSVGESNGLFSCQETWLCATGNVTSEINVNSRTTAGRSVVTVEANLQGHDTYNNTTRTLTQGGWAAVTGYYDLFILPNLHAIAERETAIPLHSMPLTAVVGRNPTNRSLTVSCEYDDRPSGLYDNAITQVIQITNTHSAQVIPQIPILGRANGPILQDIGTYTVRRKTLQIDLQLFPATQSNVVTVPNTNSLVLDYRPTGSVVYLEGDEERTDVESGKYSRTTSWLWEY